MPDREPLTVPGSPDALALAHRWRRRAASFEAQAAAQRTAGDTDYAAQLETVADDYRAAAFDADPLEAA